MVEAIDAAQQTTQDYSVVVDNPPESITDPKVSPGSSAVSALPPPTSAQLFSFRCILTTSQPSERW